MNILIVDDEVSIRKSLSYMITNEFVGKCHVYTAHSAQRALQTVRKNRIDLLISDICLGDMNGIELSKEILEIHPECKIVYVSAYDEKEYLKAAINMKVLAYIEKPIDKDLILGIIKEQIIATENKASKMDLYTNIAKTEHLVEFLLDDHKNDDAQALYQSSHLYDCSYYAVVCFAGEGIQDAFVRNKFISSLASKLHDTRIKYELLTRKEFVLIAGGEDNSLVELLRNCIFDAMDQLEIKDSVMVGIGSKKSDWREIPSSYESAIAGLNRGFFDGYHIYSSEKTDAEFDGINVFEITNRFIELLEKQNEDLLIGYVREIADNIKTQGNISKQTAIQLIESILYQINLYSGRNNILLKQPLYIDVNQIFSFDRLIRQLENMISIFCNEKSVADDVVTMAKKFIMGNYRNAGLSVKDIADHVHLNVSYLSTHFKKVCGVTINTYLTDFRIERAKEYIRSGKYNADEIGRLIGYEDSNYFYRIFKKQTGMTTKEYRKSVGK